MKPILPEGARPAAHKLALFGALALAALTLLTACGAGALHDDSAADLAEPASPSDPAGAAPERHLIRVTALETGEIRSQIETSCDVEAQAWADVHPQQTGFVRRLLVEEADRVAAGDVLAELDDAQAALRERAAGLRVEEIEREIRRQGAAIEELARKLEQQQLLEARTRAECQRLEAIPDGVLSQEELDQKRYVQEDARVARAAAESSLDQAKLNRKVTEVRLEQARVERALASLELEHTRIRAPIDGVVSERLVRVGGRIGPETKAFTVVTPRPLLAYARVPQKEIRFLRPGQPCEIACDAFPGTRFEGAVRTVSPVVEATSGTVKTTIEITADRGRLRPGMFVTVRIILEVHPQALLIPKKAILHDSDRPFVYAVAAGRVHQVFFRPGYSNRDAVEAIAPGKELQPGTRVVVRGQEKLVEGSWVEIEGDRGEKETSRPGGHPTGAEPGHGS